MLRRSARVNTPFSPFLQPVNTHLRRSQHMSKRKARDATEEMGAAVDSCKAQRSADVDTDDCLEAHMLSLCQQRGTEKTC